MRALILGPDQKAAIQKVVTYAGKRANWYLPATGSTIFPGSNPHHCVDIPMGFHCVFTFTLAKGLVWRQLSISVSDRKRRPSPEAVVMLAIEFGFSASDDEDPSQRLNIIRRMETDGWLVSEGHEGENCIVVVQVTGEGA